MKGGGGLLGWRCRRKPRALSPLKASRGRGGGDGGRLGDRFLFGPCGGPGGGGLWLSYLDPPAGWKPTSGLGTLSGPCGCDLSRGRPGLFGVLSDLSA